MNREAAALAVPVYSIFRGKLGAVDQYLADTGRLVLLRSLADIRSKLRVVRRTPTACSANNDGSTLQTITAHILRILELENRKTDQ